MEKETETLQNGQVADQSEIIKCGAEILIKYAVAFEELAK